MDSDRSYSKMTPSCNGLLLNACLENLTSYLSLITVKLCFLLSRCVKFVSSFIEKRVVVLANEKREKLILHFCRIYKHETMEKGVFTS